MGNADVEWINRSGLTVRDCGTGLYVCFPDLIRMLNQEILDADHEEVRSVLGKIRSRLGVAADRNLDARKPKKPRETPGRFGIGRWWFYRETESGEAVLCRYPSTMKRFPSYRETAELAAGLDGYGWQVLDLYTCMTPEERLLHTVMNDLDDTEEGEKHAVQVILCEKAPDRNEPDASGD